jgi:Uma2 family endonuclease
MLETGILHEDDRVELLEGEIVEMPPIGSHHASVVDRLTSLLTTHIQRNLAIVRVQNPIRLDALTEPLPDVAILRPRADFYSGDHPGPGDVVLLVEVADTSLESDRSVKLPMYASAGIAEVWIVDINSEVVETYCSSTPDGYVERRVARRGEGLSPQALPDVQLTVDDILGPPSPA